MTTFKTRIQNLLIAASTMLIFSALSASHLELRFSEETKTENAIFVNVEVMYADQGNFNLAGQNYRIYYNNDGLTLNKKDSKSLLSNDYSKIAFTQVLENLRVQGDEQLAFESNMGYANFTIDLQNLQNGGSVLPSGTWVSVARLKFDIIAGASSLDIVWGRDGMSDTYATAFVEMAEWEGAFKTQQVDVSFYGDYHYEIEANEALIEAEISVGPNPTSDFINIELTNSLEVYAMAYVFDMSGKELKHVALSAGNRNSKIDVSDLSSASYLVELKNQEAQSIHRQLIVVTK